MIYWPALKDSSINVNQAIGVCGISLNTWILIIAVAAFAIEYAYTLSWRKARFTLFKVLLGGWLVAGMTTLIISMWWR